VVEGDRRGERGGQRSQRDGDNGTLEDSAWTAQSKYYAVQAEGRSSRDRLSDEGPGRGGDMYIGIGVGTLVLILILLLILL
jgi:hypothetical protein